VFLGAVAGVALALAWIAPAGAAEPDAGATRRGALALAQERLDDARAFATVVAEKVAAAQTQKAELEAEIARAEIEIPELRARAEELQRIVRERAARLYVRSATAKLDAVVNTANVVDAARAAHHTDAIGIHDKSVATELASTAAEHEAPQVQHRAQRAEQARPIE
jgi:peptidoglycan hydrolase CwlO-like protein